MIVIDERKILEFADWELRGKYWEHKSGDDWSLGSRYFDNKPNIYSLDWQKEYLWPKISGFLYCYAIELKTLGDKWRCQLYNVASIKPLTPKRIEAIHEDPATAVLLAAMELTGKGEADGTGS